MNANPKTQTTNFEWNGHPAVQLENGLLRAVLLPEAGGKMVSLSRMDTGLEHLLPSQLPAGGYVQPSYGAPFEHDDTSGFDECFPTVAACDWTDRAWGTTTRLPDHGELWSVPWDCHVDRGTLTLCAAGRAFPYTFRKRLSLVGNRLRIDYELSNQGPAPIPYLWSAHPLLQVEEGDRLLLPSGVRKVTVAWSRAERLGPPGTTLGWPGTATSLGLQNLCTVLDGSTGWADKLFSERLDEGWCGRLNCRTGEALLFHWDVSFAPYVGLWLCYGGWPAGRPGHHTVALEPCTGWPDSLAEAATRGCARHLGGSAAVHWHLELELTRR